MTASVATLPEILSDHELSHMDAYWRACNYLCAGMIYLYENPLLREPLKPEHIKKRLLGHWGSDPGQTFLWVHLNRLIRKLDLDMIYVAGPGHGAPATLSHAWMEGTYSEVYPHISQDLEGLHKFFRQFSFPGGIGSHCTPETPGSIHEGGELGYSLSHAFGAAFDNPDLIVTCVVGDGEAETGPLATSWHSNKFLNPVRDGAVLPVLHLNGYKIANPTILARIPHEELEFLFRGYGWEPHFVEGDEPHTMHQLMAATLEQCIDRIRTIQREARDQGRLAGAGAGWPRWPMIVLRTPKGWTCPKEVDGHKVEGFWRAHQVPILEVAENPEHLRVLEEWLKSYKPWELFDEKGTPVADLRALAPEGKRRMTANPHANGGLLRRPLRMPDFRDYACQFDKPATLYAGPTEILAHFLRDIMRANPDNFRVFGPDETASNRLQAIYEASPKTWMEDILPEDSDGTDIAPTGRVMEMLSEHTLEGWFEGYVLTGRHGFFSSYEAFVHVIDSMFNQHAKWLEKSKQKFAGAPPSPPSISSSLRSSGARITTASPTRIRASSTSSPTRALRSCASICRPTRTACSASPITACAPATTSTSSLRTSSITSSTSIWTMRSATAPRALASGTSPVPTMVLSRTRFLHALAISPPWKLLPQPPSCANTSPTSSCAS